MLLPVPAVYDLFFLAAIWSNLRCRNYLQWAGLKGKWLVDIVPFYIKWLKTFFCTPKWVQQGWIDSLWEEKHMFLLGINVPPKAESNPLSGSFASFFHSESFRPVYVTLQSFKFICHSEYNKINPCHAEYFFVIHTSPIFISLTCSIPVVSMYYQSRVENSVDPYQMASLEAIWSGSTVFSKKEKSGLSRTRVKCFLQF